MSLAHAVFLAALPHRRELYQAGGWALCAGPHGAHWQDFLRAHFTALELGAAREEARAFTRALRRGSLAVGDWRALTFWESAYPDRLRHIYDPPPVLFLSGAIPAWERPAVAIVGTRRASPIAAAAVELFVQALPRETLLVSGFARGIDAAAHRAAIDSALGSVAVLGAGLAHAGPRANRALLSLAARKGVPFTLCSEFPPHRPGYAGNFPRRNRIIAGLCERTCVFQAPFKSGALITARFAMEEGRDVQAFDHEHLRRPGLNEGARKLIAEGAAPISVPQLAERLVRIPQWESPWQASDAQLTFWEQAHGGRLRPLTDDFYLRVQDEHDA